MSSSSGGSSAGALLMGAQEPRVRVVPPYVSSAGAEIIECAELAGLHLDPWQRATLTDACGERADGRWSAYEVGLAVSRQSGKGSILEARELCGAFVFGERLIIHSAHEQATSSEHFRRLLILIESVPDFDQRVRRVVKGKGSEAIELKSGERILFKTRTGGGGRGLTGDLVVLDEAMILPEQTVGALVPTMAARSLVGNPQIWYAGSAVDKTVHEHGLVFSRVRSRALEQAARVAWFEWSLDLASPDEVTPEIASDPENWARTNPGFGRRISLEHVASEQSGALGPRTFAVERLGVGDWEEPDAVKDQGLDYELWLALEDRASRPLDPVSFAYDVTPDRGYSAIAAGGMRADGLGHVEIIEHAAGTHWVVDRLVALNAKHRPHEVVCDERSPAMSLVDDLRAAGVNVRTLSASEHAQACGQFADAVNDPNGGTMRHLGSPELNAAARGAVKRPLGDAWAWSRRNSKVDISPIVAGTLAYASARRAAQSAPWVGAY
ncbi:terminase [Paraconexibacter algicola]|uniref:terminase n=1 Tax=Paraconexibacter algicola TaxID=2133960 RepID=UPI001304B200|nr:terminase [Paraconexibacter algicola]